MKLRKHLAAGLLTVFLFLTVCGTAAAEEEANMIDFTFSWKENAQHYRIYVNGTLDAELDITSYVREQFKPDGVIRNYGGQGGAYIWLPSEQSEKIRTPVVVAAHGSGRGGDDYYKTDFYTEQRIIAKKYGYGFAVISNDRDGWGTDDGVSNLIGFCKNLSAEWPVTEQMGIWATSAGGVTALRSIASGEFGTDFYIGTFPVYDLITEYRVLPSCRAAFGDVSADVFAEQVAGKNPPDLTEQLLASDCHFYVTHGDADQAVPINENSVRLAEDLGDAVMLEVIPGGVHGTDDYSFYGKAVEQAFADHPAQYIYTGSMAAGDIIRLETDFADGSTTTEEYHVDEKGDIAEGLPVVPDETGTDETEAEQPDILTEPLEKKTWNPVPVIAVLAAASAGVVTLILRRKRR